jgi:hypothetical protein
MHTKQLCVSEPACLPIILVPFSVTLFLVMSNGLAVVGAAVGGLDPSRASGAKSWILLDI